MKNRQNSPIDKQILQVRSLIRDLGSDNPMKQSHAEYALREMGPNVLDIAKNTQTKNEVTTFISSVAGSAVGLGYIVQWFWETFSKSIRGNPMLLVVGFGLLIGAMIFLKWQYGLYQRWKVGIVRVAGLWDDVRSTELLLSLNAYGRLNREGAELLTRKLQNIPKEDALLSQESMPGLLASLYHPNVELRLAVLEFLQKKLPHLPAIPALRKLARRKPRTTYDVLIQGEAQRTLEILEEVRRHQNTPAE